MIPRWIEAVIGIALMAAPAVLGYGDPHQASHRIAGPVAAALAVIAMTDATRGVRWANLPVAAWLLLSAIVLNGPAAARAVSAMAGVALLIMVSRGGRTTTRIGGGWRALVHPERGSAVEAERSREAVEVDEEVSQ